MPTLRKDRENQWMARISINGKQVATQMFAAGRKKGVEWTAARQWEVEKKAAIETLLQQGLTLSCALTQLGLKTDLLPEETIPIQQTPTVSDGLIAWGDKYLDHVKRTMTRQTYVEKQTVLRAFFQYCGEEGISSPDGITKPMAYQFLADIADERSNNRANVYRKNLLAAWNWGMDFVEGFPTTAVFERIRPFPSDRGVRYVPPEEDVVAVLEQAQGQDLVMLLTYYFTGARRSEVFRLSWDRDIQLRDGMVRLTDHKGGSGAQHVRWQKMHPELVKALAWWWKMRPRQVDNVFMQVHCDGSLGLPFRQRNKLMPRLCAKAGVKPFGFHALRHKAAAISFAAGGLVAAQALMGHYRATTTDTYVQSAGLYADRSLIPSALGENVIGQSASKLLKMEMPHGPEPREALCNQKSVTNRLQ